MKNLFFLIMTILVLKLLLPEIGEAAGELVMLVIRVLTAALGSVDPGMDDMPR